jgi:hypothetical protein
MKVTDARIRAKTEELLATYDEDAVGVPIAMAYQAVAGILTGWTTEQFRAEKVCCTAVQMIRDWLAEVGADLTIG